MPRKKTVQPPPLQEFYLSDGTLVEVRDENCWEVAPGQHRVKEYQMKRDNVLVRVADDYLTCEGRRATTPDYMDSATKFARRCELWGFGSPDGSDDSSLRKKLYSDIVQQIRILESAIDAVRNKSP